ncbi:MAG: Chaperone protein HtpG [Calditrichaeota bacterium]|nr:Chaperone protein HtpG [Calditrichota bacterium]
MSETNTSKQTMQFEAEVSQLLNIVINSLYTDREIFVRELISNASDALEKVRRLQLTDKDNIADPELPLEIRIRVDDKANTFEISDTGVGMTRDEAVRNLGTIAHSGSREFIRALGEDGLDAKDLIGQFGVGFYSAFMVAKKVTVHTRAADPDASPIVWSSTGAGSFEVRESERFPRGTTVTIDLKESEQRFADADEIKTLIKRFSNFVPFPISVGDEQVNTVKPLWTKGASEIGDDELTEFYRFVANAHDEPIYHLQFNADAPLAIRSLLFVPESNLEQFGFARMEHGVSLYCRHVLIQSQAEDLLPDYFRFVRGVVDSEDLPLNISRETMQDSALVAKLRRVLTKRLIKFLAEKADEDADRYGEFFDTFGMFIKEGVASDFDHRNELAKLLRYESSATKPGETTSLGQYVERMPDEQQAIYYISGPNRDAIEAGPYLEALQERGFEVIHCFEGVDDFVFNNLREFDGKPLVSADSADLKLPDDDKKEGESGEQTEQEEDEALDERAAGDLAAWVKNALGEEVGEVKVSKRLVRSPTALVNPDEFMTTGMKRVMQQFDRGGAMPVAQMVLEINPRHAIIKRVDALRRQDKDSGLAKEAARLLLANAQIAAGLIVDPKALMERSTRILEAALGAE